MAPFEAQWWDTGFKMLITRWQQAKVQPRRALFELSKLLAKFNNQATKTNCCNCLYWLPESTFFGRIRLSGISILLSAMFAATVPDTGQPPDRWRESFNRMVLKVNPLIPHRHTSKASPLEFHHCTGGRGKPWHSFFIVTIMDGLNIKLWKGQQNTLQPVVNGAP